MSDHTIPGFAQTYSKAPDKWAPNAPRYAAFGKGPYLYASMRPGDQTAEKYIDCTSALGAIILGYRYPEVEARVREQMGCGSSFSLPTLPEQQLAERLVKLIPCAEMVRFGKNGADVTGAAVRIARAVTGKDFILYNAYHGHHDWSMGYPPKNGGVPRCMRERSQKILDCDLSALEEALGDGNVAAVVLEPVVTVTCQIPERGYFQEARRLCDEHGALLILDEMVTAFRVGFPGAVTKWDIDADLWCGAKGLGNGYPITALCGKREYMERIEQDVFYSTTFAGEAVSMAAALATLDVLEATEAHEQIERAGNQFRTGVTLALEHHGVPGEVVGFPARPVLRGTPPELMAALVDKGVLCQGYLNVTLAHGEVITDLLEAFNGAIEAVSGEGG